MNEGAQNSKSISFIEFLKENWINGEYKMLYNTISQVDHQRRAFSHSGVRLDIFPKDEDNQPFVKSTPTPNAVAFRNKIPTMLKDDGCLTSPITKEKIETIYELFDDCAKDITTDPQWDTFWKDWESSFIEAVRNEPETYLTPKQLQNYKSQPNETAQNQFLEQFMYEHKQGVMNRVKSAYAFKMLSELLVSRKIDKHKCVFLQTIANHMDEFNAEGMLNYLRDKKVDAFLDISKSYFDTLYEMTQLGQGKSDNITMEELDQLLPELISGDVTDELGNVTHVQGLKDSQAYQNLDPDLREQLLHDFFEGERAKTKILDQIERKHFYLELKGEVESYLKSTNKATLDKTHLDKLEQLQKLLGLNEFRDIDIAIDKDEFTQSTLPDVEKVNKLIQTLELHWAQDHMARNLDTWIASYTHGRVKKEELYEHFESFIENDKVNNDNVPTKIILKHQINQWLNQSPTIEELRDLRDIMESDPSDENRSQYYQALDSAKSISNEAIQEAIQVADIREKWLEKAANGNELESQAQGYIQDASRMRPQIEPPMTSNKISSIYIAFSDLNDDLLEDPEFIRDMQALPDDLQEMTKMQVLAKYRETAIKECDFYKGVDLKEQDKKQHQAQLEDILLKVNDEFGKTIDPNVAFENIRKVSHKLLTKQTANAVSDVRSSILKGKVDLDALLGKCDAHLKDLRSSTAAQFLDQQVVDDELEPLVSLKNDYKAIHDIVVDKTKQIAENFVPTDGKESRTVVQELIEQYANEVQNSDVFKGRPIIGLATLNELIMGQEAQERIKQAALKARIEYFTNTHLTSREKPLNEVLKELVTSKKNGLRWVRNHPARRAVIDELAKNILNGEANFKQQSGFAKFFGVTVSSDQRQALKALQSEYLRCIKTELAQCKTNQEALELIQDFKQSEMMKPLPRSTFGSLFTKKNNSALKELKSLEAQIQNNSSNATPAQLPSLKNYEKLDQGDKLFTPKTSPEQDVAQGFKEQLNEHLLNFNTEYALAASLEDFQQDERVKMLKKAEQLDALKASLYSIEDLEQRRNEINRLFASVHDGNTKHGMFSDQKFGSKQKLAIGALQEVFKETVKEQLFDEIWKHSDSDNKPNYDSEKMFFSSEHLHPEQLPRELDPRAKDTIYHDVLASCRKDPIFQCDAKSSSKQKLHDTVQNLAEVLNNIYDPGISSTQRQALDQERERQSRPNRMRG